VVNDGDVNSAAVTSTITVAAVNDAPVVAGSSSLGYTENDAATIIDGSISVSDLNDTNIESATITISANYITGQDVLAFTDTGNITGSFNATTGVLTLTGTDTVANYQAALRAVTYRNTSDNPSTAARTVSFVVNYGDDVNSPDVTRIINITDTPEAAIITIDTEPLPVRSFSSPNLIDGYRSSDAATGSVLISDFVTKPGPFNQTLDNSNSNIVFDSVALAFKNGDGTHNSPLTTNVLPGGKVLVASVLGTDQTEIIIDGLTSDEGSIERETVDNRTDIYYQPSPTFSGNADFSATVLKDGVRQAQYNIVIDVSQKNGVLTPGNTETKDAKIINNVTKLSESLDTTLSTEVKKGLLEKLKANILSKFNYAENQQNVEFNENEAKFKIELAKARLLGMIDENKGNKDQNTEF